MSYYESELLRLNMHMIVHLNMHCIISFLIFAPFDIRFVVILSLWDSESQLDMIELVHPVKFKLPACTMHTIFF